MRKKDKRTIARVLDAASRTETRNAREAAIVGGIVRSVIDTGHFKPGYVQHYTSEVLRWFARDMQKMIDLGAMASLPAMAMPTPGEVSRMVQRFMDRYNEPPTQPVAA